ncbi:globin domain-containing protein [Dyadobacter sp. 3J3]|uniref:globin domain-containing protein n=1 Tax=Dyadobacter sp. 3J3 TaxID=2606600 RepID=UPI00135BBD8E|nr:globin domain-containing protein [Dyadobacter sp. 3J3]
MKNSKILIIKNSWFHIVNNTENAGEYFYEVLFELDPTLKPMFKTNTEEQSKKLVTMLSYVISKLNALDEIMPQIQGLAQRHSKYGVNAEHYQVVGQALIQMLEYKLEKQWNEEIKDAWLEVYTILSSAMIRSASEVSNV